MTKKPTTETPTEPPRDPLDDAFVFLKSIPTRAEYKGMAATEAYAFHADQLLAAAKESDAAAVPVGSHAHERHSTAAAQTRQRARMCSLVADGQSIQAAIATVLANKSLEPETPEQPKTKTRASKQALASV